MSTHAIARRSASTGGIVETYKFNIKQNKIIEILMRRIKPRVSRSVGKILGVK
jgi:hypothetical protein